MKPASIGSFSAVRFGIDAVKKPFKTVPSAPSVLQALPTA